jgi:pyridoxamine 5'-phosphate oxidase-like protein
MRAVIQAAHLCFAATVSPDGMPNVSPKGTLRVWDDEHLFFLDLASPGTRANLRARPWMELNVVEQLSRRGYLAIERAAPLVSPGYSRVPDKSAMRAMWRNRRAALDREFEAYLARAGAFRPGF